MKRLLSFAIVALALTVIAQAQYTPSGPPASVTSIQPAAPGAAKATAGPTVTSGSFSPTFVPGVRARHHNGRHSSGSGSGRGRFGTQFAPDWAFSPGFIAVPVPVPVDADGNPIQPGDPETMAQQQAEDEAPAYTVFEHRNRNAFPMNDYSEMRSSVMRPRAIEPSTEATTPSVPEQPATVLVFRDGHQLEITNYAIQSGTIFNMSDNGPRKIALADLDVDKTVKANDERGVDFTVPTAR